mmetsp:Transcript_9813/g.28087  ORF Transcript_9813/g.28087 Transcript_9813/m.28087 type:complete len:237 (+) Transcript_9813:892-1602(+)
MHAQNLLIHQGCNRQAVEAVSEGLPQPDVVAPLALVIKPVDAVDGCAFVVATQEEEVLRVLDLVGQQKGDGLKALLAAVNIVTQEKVVGLRREAAVLEQAQQVAVLAVDVPANLNGCLQLQQVGLAHEDLLGGDAQLPDLLLRELDLLARAPVADVQQAVDNIVEKSLLHCSITSPAEQRRTFTHGPLFHVPGTLPVGGIHRECGRTGGRGGAPIRRRGRDVSKTPGNTRARYRYG